MQYRLRKKVRKREAGANLTEYALLVTLIAVVCVVAIQSLGGSVSTKISTIASGVRN